MNLKPCHAFTDILKFHGKFIHAIDKEDWKLVDEALKQYKTVDKFPDETKADIVRTTNLFSEPKIEQFVSRLILPSIPSKTTEYREALCHIFNLPTPSDTKLSKHTLKTLPEHVVTALEERTMTPQIRQDSP